jgi:hypothetical protein
VDRLNKIQRLDFDRSAIAQCLMQPLPVVEAPAFDGAQELLWQRSASGDAPEFSQSSKRSIELISVAKPDAIDAMRRGTMDTIGVLPERPGLEGRRYVEWFRPVVLGKPKKALR